MSNLQTVQMLAKRSSGICILVEISKHGSAVLQVSFTYRGTKAYRTKPHPAASSLFATPLGPSRLNPPGTSFSRSPTSAFPRSG